MSIKGRFERFTRNTRPTDEHFEEATRQIEYMIDRLKSRVSKDGAFTLEKILRAGSNAKHTSLLKTEENLFDVDLGAYFSGEGATKEHLSGLLEFTRDQLISIYPTKDAKHFEILKSAVRVKFVSGIELWVDIAPIISDKSLKIENGGWLPRPDEWRLTSVTCHNDFVRTRSARSGEAEGPVKFNRLVRMLKWWNNRQGKLVQPSIFCELIAAAALDESGVTDEWQSTLRKVFLFLRKHQLKRPILFPDYYDPKTVKLSSHPIIVLDSVNASNNITSLWTESTRIDFMERVEEAYEAMLDAKSAELDGDEDEAVEQWCRVFGDAFRSLSAPEEE
jgi:hypothetical protein